MEQLFNVEALDERIRRVVREELAAARPGPAELMTTAEAAGHARVKPATIRDWVRVGRLRAQRVGRHLRVRRADLDAAIEAWTRGMRNRESTEARGRREALRALGRAA
jgi:excisionase family DNA binding protein